MTFGRSVVPHPPILAVDGSDSELPAAEVDEWIDAAEQTTDRSGSGAEHQTG